MSNDTSSNGELTTKKKLLFGISAIPDQMTYQAFSLYIFTFYFAVIDIGLFLTWLGFIIWTGWNMINDPLLGALSDRTRHRGKWGKRKFYLLISIIPLSLAMIFLFTVTVVNDVSPIT